MNDSILETIVNDSQLAMPLLLWPALAIILLVVQIINPRPKLALGLSLAGLLGMIGFSVASFDSSAAASLFVGTVAWDPISQSFNILTQLIVLSVVLMMVPGLSSTKGIFQDGYEQLPEFLICLILSGFGAGVLVSAKDLTSLFLGLEILSIGIYCLCGFFRKEIQSTESAIKYLLIGAFATVIFLYGTAFVYGATGATQYDQIFAALSSGSLSVLARFGIVFMMAGFAFKLAFVPFHLYTADVYEGAPTPVTAYMATILKVAMAGAFLRVFWGLFAESAIWTPLWLGLCLLSILVGNIAALQQQTLKRLLAFSSISHAGFVGLALLIAKPGTGSVFPLMAYLVVYTLMSLGSFALISLLEDREKPFRLEDLKGLGRSRVVVGLALAVCLLGLAGIPPFAGFMVKFWVFQGLLEQGFWGAALVAVVGSIIGAAYYLRLLIYIFVSQEEGAALRWVPLGDRFLTLRLVIAVCVLLTLIGGVWPGFYADWILGALAIR
jgi:NADH-quinone oxidoreductase subunit N